MQRFVWFETGLFQVFPTDGFRIRESVAISPRRLGPESRHDPAPSADLLGGFTSPTLLPISTPHRFFSPF